MRGRESDATYFMRRAREEACLALKAEAPEIAAAHHGLAVQYSARLRQETQAPPITASAFPHFGNAVAKPRAELLVRIK
jgi:hypothetical protein